MPYLLCLHDIWLSLRGSVPVGFSIRQGQRSFVSPPQREKYLAMDFYEQIGERFPGFKTGMLVPRFEPRRNEYIDPTVDSAAFCRLV
jgi:hypothetical protein